MGKIAKYLNQLTVGNVFDAPEVLEAYSTDCSVLKIKPKFVAFPESTDDIRKLLRFFNKLCEKDIKLAITPRGSGLDETGADLTNGLVISTEKLNKLLEIDPRERLVRVQAGITLKELNTALSVSGLTIPIEGHDDDTIGGLISNCPVDNYAGKYGGIMNYIERLEVILPNGDYLQTNRYKKYAFAKKAAEKSTEGIIYHKIARLIKDNENLLKDISKDKDLAGYPFVTKVKKRETFDLMPLFFGAQGTLGVISEVILKAATLKSKPTRVVVTFKDIEASTAFLKEISSLNPRELNLFDLKIIMEARESGKNLDGVIRKLEDGFVVFASFDEKNSTILKKLNLLKEKYPKNTKFIIESAENKSVLNEFENSLTHYLGNIRNGERAPILTNFYIPEWNLKNFLDDLAILGQKLNLDLALYGSYATSIYHLRPKFDLSDKETAKKIATFLKAGAYVIERQGGELVGGLPEGRIKAMITKDTMLAAKRDLDEDIKKIFDPNGIMNPDIKLHVSPKFTVTHFRTEPIPKVMV